MEVEGAPAEGGPSEQNRHAATKEPVLRRGEGRTDGEVVDAVAVEVACGEGLAGVIFSALGKDAAHGAADGGGGDVEVRALDGGPAEKDIDGAVVGANRAAPQGRAEG